MVSEYIHHCYVVSWRTMKRLAEDLADLGLSGYEAAVYLALLGRGGIAPSEIATRARIPRQRIYDVLESLAGKGLCSGRDTTPKTFFAADPAIGLEGLRQRRAAALERDIAETQKKAGDLIQELMPIFQSGLGQSDPLAYIDVLNDPVRIAARALELARAAQTTVNSCIRRPLILSQEQNWQFIQEPLERGLHYRALYEREALDDPELREWMETFRNMGQQIRLVAVLPIKMNAFDDTAALLSLQDPVGGPPSFTALAIGHRGAVAFLNMAFEHLWQQGEPLP